MTQPSPAPLLSGACPAVLSLATAAQTHEDDTTRIPTGAPDSFSWTENVDFGDVAGDSAPGPACAPPGTHSSPATSLGRAGTEAGEESVLTEALQLLQQPGEVGGAASDVAGLAATLLGDGDGDRIGVDVDCDETVRLAHGPAPRVALRDRGSLLLQEP